MFWWGKDKAIENAIWSRWYYKIRRGGPGALEGPTQLGQYWVRVYTILSFIVFLFHNNK